ncbi:Unknown protein, partial [Striga hermonthica]
QASALPNSTPERPTSPARVARVPVVYPRCQQRPIVHVRASTVAGVHGSGQSSPASVQLSLVVQSSTPATVPAHAR